MDGFRSRRTASGCGFCPYGISETLLFDQSGYTLDRLADVGINMAIGVAIVVAVLFVTLGVRAAVIVAVILPVVGLATLATMNFIGLPIHQMSVTGLIVALGLMVDAAIVMTDESAEGWRMAFLGRWRWATPCAACSRLLLRRPSQRPCPSHQ